MCVWAATFPDQNESSFFYACPHLFRSTSRFLRLCLHLVNLLHVFLCRSRSNRVEAWTRDVQFLLRQEPRPVAQLVGNMSTMRIMRKDWENIDKATNWIHQRAAPSHQPFALYVGLNLPHPYRTESMGPTAGGSTFRTSPYWLGKACSYFVHYFNVFVPLLLRYIVCFYINHSKMLSAYFTNTGVFRAHHCS